MRKKLKNETGITLIALVITIIVLLILAGVSIATLTGQNGILTQANDAKQATTQGKAEELVSLAIGALQTENLGDTSKITPNAIASKVNQDNNRTDVTAEGITFPTNINFVDDGVKVKVDSDLSIGEGEDKPEGDYSISVDEKEIAPADLFKIEIVENEQASTNNLATTGYAKILGIKEQYCNKGGYEAEDGTTYEDTNYGIRYNENGFEINDKLIIPAYIEKDGVKYPVKEVSLTIYPAPGENEYGFTNRPVNLPSINTIVYPNTVERLVTTSDWNTDGSKCLQVILPKNIKEIPGGLFVGCNELNNITIPLSVTSIGDLAFYYCRNLTNITIPMSVTSVGENSFYNSGLTNITIPSSVTKIADYAFSDCYDLTEVTYKEMKYNSATELISVLTNNGVEVNGSAFHGSGIDND